MTKNKKLNIVFMGTPEFAVASLEKIFLSSHNLLAVVTVPDKPAGRGKKLKPSEVKNFALAHNIPLLQPEKMKDPNFYDSLKILNADLFVVVAFRMLPESIWTMPSIGTFNLHASILPQYRGAAPINHAIINGEKKTGVTTFFIDKEIDTGKIIMQQEIEILNDDDAGIIHDRLMNIGAQLVMSTIDSIAKENLILISQSDKISEETKLNSAPKIFKQDCKINWNKPAKDILNLIRGLSPYPAAFSVLKLEDNKKFVLKIFKAKISKMKENKREVGSIISDNDNFICVVCENEIIEILELQLEGKKRLSTKDFLHGFRKISNSSLELS